MMACQSVQPGRLSRSCMALTKYSYAVVSLSYPGPIPWTHIQLNCFAVFESSSSQISQGVEQSQKFKVLQDLSTLVFL